MGFSSYARMLVIYGYDYGCIRDTRLYTSFDVLEMPHMPLFHKAYEDMVSRHGIDFFFPFFLRQRDFERQYLIS